jgi:hypothetical protein
MAERLVDVLSIAIPDRLLSGISCCTSSTIEVHDPSSILRHTVRILNTVEDGLAVR